MGFSIDGRLVLGGLIYGLSLAVMAAQISVEQSSSFDTKSVAQGLPQLPFVENRGQAGNGIAYYLRSGNGAVYVTEEAALVYAMESKPRTGDDARLCVLRERFPVKSGGRPTGLGEPQIRVNFFHGEDPKAWVHGAPAYERLALGVDEGGVSYHLDIVDAGVRRVITVPAGVSIDGVRVMVEGARSLRNRDDGALVIESACGLAQLTAPIAYQEGPSGRQTVQVGYVVDEDRYGFRLGAYDRSRPVIIDPLLASTYLGGSEYDHVADITKDSSGNIYLTGSTRSADFPTTPGTYSNDFVPTTDAFIARLDADLKNLQAATYFSAGAENYGEAIAIKEHQYSPTQVFVGVSIYEYPGVFPLGEASVLEFNTDLTELVERRKLFYPRRAAIRAFARAPWGGLYAAGAIDTGQVEQGIDVFIWPLQPQTQGIIFGGSQTDEANGLAIYHDVNSDNRDYCVAGWTDSTDFPVPELTGGDYFDRDYNGGPSDAFAACWSGGQGSAPIATYLGGAGEDRAESIAVDAQGRPVVTGWTASANFPTTEGALDTSLGGSSDAFVTRIHQNFQSLVASTYLGGSGGDEARDIVLGNGGEVYIAGHTGSDDFPVTPRAFRRISSSDAFITRMDSGLQNVEASTYLGGSMGDGARGLLLTDAGDVYLLGETTSADFPTHEEGYAQSYRGSQDAFIARLDPHFTNLSPYLVASPASHHFGNVTVGFSKQLHLALSNTGSMDLEVTGLALSDPTHFMLFYIQPQDGFIIGPGKTRSVIVQFSPRERGDFETELVIATDATDTPEVRVPLSGKGSFLQAHTPQLYWPEIRPWDPPLFHDVYIPYRTWEPWVPFFTAYLTWNEPVPMRLSAYGPDGELRMTVEAASSPLKLTLPRSDEGDWRFEVTPADATQPGPPVILVVYAPDGVVWGNILIAFIVLAILLMIVLVWRQRQ